MRARKKSDLFFHILDYFSDLTINNDFFLSCQIYFISMDKYKSFSYPSYSSIFIRRFHVAAYEDTDK